MEATVIDFILSTLMSFSAQYPDAAWLVTALSVVMTVCGLCAVATVWMPVPKEPAGLYAVFYRWAHALSLIHICFFSLARDPIMLSINIEP